MVGNRLLAGLAGIGAAYLVGTVVSGVLLELWLLRIIVTDGPAPRPDQVSLFVFLVGSFVAARLGGSRAVGIVSFSSRRSSRAGSPESPLCVLGASFSLLFGGILAIGVIPVPLHQLGMAWNEGLAATLSQVAGVVGVLVFVVVAFVGEHSDVSKPLSRGARTLQT